MEDKILIDPREDTPSDTETSTEFVIEDDGLADWALRKVAELRTETAAWEQHFADQMNRIRDRNDRMESFFLAALARYFDTVPKRQTKTQSKYALPSSELLRKVQGPKFQQDDSILIPFLQKNGMCEYVKNKPVADWAALKKRCEVLDDGSVVDTETGLIVDGVTAEHRPEKFEVKINV